MSRQIQGCFDRLEARIVEIGDFADRIEELEYSGGVAVTRKIKDGLLGYVLMRYFIAWEDFLEEIFPRFLCGYRGTSNRQVSLPLGRHPTVAAAEAALLGTRNYLTWNHGATVARSVANFGAGNIVQTTLNLHQTDIENINKVRNATAHRSAFAWRNFTDVVTTELGVMPSGMTPGKFLRMVNTAPTAGGLTYVRYYGVSLVIIANTIAAN
jgi:hypothetical protein